MLQLALALLLIGAGEPALPASPAGRPAPSTPPSAGPPASGEQTLACADFRRQPDGAWTPRAPVRVGGMVVTPAMSFSRGVSFGGVDPAAILDARCVKSGGR